MIELVFIEKCTMSVQNISCFRQKCTIFLKYCAFFLFTKEFCYVKLFLGD